MTKGPWIGWFFTEGIFSGITTWRMTNRSCLDGIPSHTVINGKAYFGNFWTRVVNSENHLRGWDGFWLPTSGHWKSQGFWFCCFAWRQRETPCLGYSNVRWAAPKGPHATAPSRHRPVGFWAFCPPRGRLWQKTLLALKIWHASSNHIGNTFKFNMYVYIILLYHIILYNIIL